MAVVVNGVPFALNDTGLFAILEAPLGPTSRYVTEIAETVAALARDNVNNQFTRRSGTLHDSIGVFPKETADGLAMEIGTEGAPYGRILELGGEAHEIRAVNRRVMFSEPDNPNPLLAAQVRVVHPGPPARPWLVPALEAVFNGG